MARPRSEPPDISRLPAIMREITELRNETLDRLAALEHQVAMLCRDGGATWQAIADEFDISRQAAESRFKKARRRRSS